MFVFADDQWEIQRLVVGTMSANCYFLIQRHTQQTLIIDPGDEGDFLSEQILNLQLQPVGIFFTHGHCDHVGGALALWLNFASPKLPVFLHPLDQPLYQRAAATAKHFNYGIADPIIPIRQTQAWSSSWWQKLFPQAKAQVLDLPGHTPGGMALYLPQNNFIFVGDLLFADGSVGRSDFAYSQRAQLKKSLQQIKSLPSATLILPGHEEPFTLENVL